jgi:succinoglycan biosynthesis transport protein ExoP
MSEQSKRWKKDPAEATDHMVQAEEYSRIARHHEMETIGVAVPLSHYIWTLRRHMWKILAFVAFCLLATAIVTARLKPIYESTATIVIDRQAPAEVVGQDSSRSAAQNDAEQFLATQIKLIQSDAVVRPVAEQFHLLRQDDNSNGKGTEQERQTTGAPVTLSSLRVTRAPNTYLLLISYRSQDKDLAARIANAVAQSYLTHTYTLRIRSTTELSQFMEKQLDELKARMERSNSALAEFEKFLGVVNPSERTNILTSQLLQLNTEYTTVQAERIRKEAAWNAMRQGSVETAQVSSQGAALSRLTDDLNQARQRLALVKSTYGTKHPEYRKAASTVTELEREFEDSRENIGKRIEAEYRMSVDHEQMLEKAVARTKNEWDQVNLHSFEYQRLKEEADSNKALYDELIKKIQEADINAGFQNNNIRIADLARPASRPVFPDIKSSFFLSLLLSTLMAIGVALLLDSLDTTLRDQDETSRFLGIDVIGTLPADLNACQIRKITLAPVSRIGSVNVTPSAEDRTQARKDGYSAISGFEEAVRTIRNTIFLADIEQRIRSIMITSASPSEGKTTVATHLAIASAERGKRTLMVDGDLRQPSLHARFGFVPQIGLSSVLTDECKWKDAVLKVEGRKNLELLPSGPSSHRAADLIGPRLPELLDEFLKEYDLVILDSPPLLGFAECLQMASAADGVLIVCLAGETRRKAVAAVVSMLRKVRANVIGLVLNQVKPNTSPEAYPYYGYYRRGYDQK